MGFKSIAALLEVVPERIRQIEKRALMKLKIAKDVMAKIEEIRANLPAGVRLVTTFPRHNDEGSMLFEVVVRFPVGTENKIASGVIRRRVKGR